MRHRAGLAGAAALIALALASCDAGMSSRFAAEGERPDCEIDRGQCSKTVGDMIITLDIDPKPVKAMEELKFRLVVASNAPLSRTEEGATPQLPDELIIDLSMPGMYMGRNFVPMRMTPDGTYLGKGVVPRCPSGRRLWKAKVAVPEVADVDFSFNVTY